MIAVATTLILGGVGVVIGLLTQQDRGSQSLPRRCRHPTRPAEISPHPTAMPFRGLLLQQPSLEVRAEPVLSAPVTGYLPFETEVYIVCTTIGDVVEGPGAGGAPSISTPVWDKVRTAATAPTSVSYPTHG